MAIFYFNAQAISRSSGKNACRAAAYNSRSEIVDLKTQKTYNYSDRTDLAHSLIITPQVNGYSFNIDRSTLWNSVEATETRVDSQLARSLVLALPTEIDNQAKWLMTQQFVRDIFTSKGMIADVNIHDIDSHNPHIHILLTMRDISEITPSGEIVFGLKNRSWNDKKLLERQKESWATIVNKHLELAQVPDRIDHRSYEERGIERIPQIHIGETAWKMEQRGIKTERGDLHRQITAANEQIEQFRAEIAVVQQNLEDELRQEVKRREAQQHQNQQRAKSQQREKAEPETEPKQPNPTRPHLQHINIPSGDVKKLGDVMGAALARERQQKEQKQEAERIKQVEAALPLTVESAPTIIIQDSDKYIPTRQELITWWYQSAPGADRDEIGILGQQLKDDYLQQGYIGSQPVTEQLPDNYHSDLVSISRSDRQRFDERKHQTPLGQFIIKCQELLAQDPSGRIKYNITKTRAALKDISKQDLINKEGIEVLDRQLANYALMNKIEMANLIKLIPDLEQIRDNPEQYKKSRQKDIQESIQKEANRAVTENYERSKQEQQKRQSRPQTRDDFGR